MELRPLLMRLGSHVDPRVASRLYRVAKRVPAVRRAVERELDGLMNEVERSLRPYRDSTETHTALPAQGVAREELLGTMRELAALEQGSWRDGFVSGGVYHGDPEHVSFLNEVVALHSQANPLHADLWPSVSKYEAEVVAMTARMLGGDDGVCGTVSSGGTESILLAMKSYRDRARAERGITTPEIVAPVTAHAAFDKAAQYFGMKLVSAPLAPDYRVDLAAVRAACNRRTAVIVGSAPNFPHGAIDPIEELSELARSKGIGCHVDACLGGFVLPFARKLGAKVPAFDFALPGVTTMSVDTHKYGYAAKGTSVVLYRDAELRRWQYFTTTDWPGGLYFSPTFAGSRPGALSAAAWASLLSLGEAGYLDATRRLLAAAATIRAGVESIPELTVLGDPLWVIAFTSTDLDIYRILDQMTHHGWSLNGLHRPAAVHIAVTLRHAQPGVAERFVEHLREAVAHVRATPEEPGGMAPVYGLAGTLPVRALVGELLLRYVDALYKVD